MTQSEYTINSVLDPVSIDEFFSQYWEKKPLHISRSRPEQYADLLKLIDIESLLSTNQLRFPQLQLTQSGKSISVRDYADADNQILPNRFVQQHLDGATIVLSQANTLFPSLAVLCRHVNNRLKMQCQANVYLSPACNQGFNAHYDTHDVFILQVSGRKSFNFYGSGVDLPFVHEAYNPDLNKSQEIEETIDLMPGDTLYIPRGMVHDAVAQDEASLHITLGVFAVVLRDLLTEMVQIAAEQEVNLRASIPRGTWLGGGLDTNHLTITAMLNDVLKTDIMNAALCRLRDDVAMNGVQSCQDLLSNRALKKGASSDSQIIINQHALMSNERCDSRYFLRASGKVVEFVEPLSSAVEWILARDQFCVADVPGLDGQQQIALVDRLLREDIVSLIQ